MFLISVPNQKEGECLLNPVFQASGGENGANC